MRKALKILGILLLAVLVLAAAYLAYVFLAYHRIPDNQPLTAEGSAAGILRPGESYRALSYNIGFGAYEDDYSFFMDGGSESWAWSRERLNENLSGISAELKSANADLYFLQEVDHDSTRTYHVDEREFLYAAQPGYASVYAVNYDSPFLFYPLHQPHGSSRAGLMTLTKLAVSSAERRSLPVETGVTKLVDPAAKDKQTLALLDALVDWQKEDKLFEHQQLFKTPIVRNGRQATVGYQPDVWKSWE